ncbi:MAG: ribosome biogenesis GTPase YlqF [Lachnospiraceae bacterium]|nr:ribosome biogenesis GTPase YlqF [Lachnospiraceae bacterium]
MIQWYPGHMEKARRSMRESLKLVDLVIEVLDARAPLSCLNPEIDRMGEGKARLFLLNKADMADPGMNRYWKEVFEAEGRPTLLINARTGEGMKEFDRAVESIMAERKERNARRGIINRPVRAMVAGIPNSGKSTFINRFVKKAVTKTGNRPGVTRGNQWIRMGKGMELLDTPGILWPKIEREECGWNLALIGSVNDAIVQTEDLASHALKKVRALNPGTLAERYGADKSMNDTDIFAAAAGRFSMLLPGGEADIKRAAGMVIDDFRSLKLGRITVDEKET